MWFCGSSCVCNLLSILVCMIKELWHGSWELAAAFTAGSCQNKTSTLYHRGQTQIPRYSVPSFNANNITNLSLCFVIFLFLWWLTPFFSNHKNISLNNLLGHLIPLCSEESRCKYLAVCDSCLPNTDEKGRRGLITGFLLIALHLTYFSLATWDYKKKLLI